MAAADEQEWGPIFLKRDQQWCLATDSDSPDNGSAIILSQFTGEDHQLWSFDGTWFRLKANPDGKFKNGLVLERKLGHSEPANGKLLQVWAFNDRAVGQKFEFDSKYEDREDWCVKNEGAIKLIQNTDFVIHASPDDWGRIQLWENHSGDNQQWTHAVKKPEIDPMAMADALVNMREQAVESFCEEEKMRGILNQVESLDALEGAVMEAVQAFTDDFVESSDILSESGDISKPVEKIMAEYIPVYEETMQEKVGSLLGYVFGEFAQNFMDGIIEAAGDSEDNIPELVTSRIDELANAFVGEDEFLASKGVPEGSLEEQSSAAQEAFVNEYVLRVTDAQEAAVVAAASELYRQCTDTRNIQYLFEMSRESVDQEEFDKTAVVEAIETLKAKVEEISELDVGRLEAGERENALSFWNDAQGYALAEASYLRTRADRIQQKGARRITESYAQIRAIEGNVAQTVQALTFHYDDDTFRKYGVDDEVSFNITTEDLEPGERIVKVDCWDTKHRDSVAEGIRFHTTNGREISFIGKKAKGFFGMDSIDHKWRPDGGDGEDYIVGLKFGERDNKYHPRGVTGRSNEKKPGGDWEDAVDEWRFEGNKLIYTIGENTSYFIPLPWETVKIENGMMIVDSRLMEE